MSVGVFVFVLAQAAVVFAQATGAQSNGGGEATSPGPIVTDRPTDSASPVLVPRHTFQLEAGYKFTHLDEDGGIDLQVLPDLLARYGISKKVEARLVSSGWTIESGAESETGFNDVSLGAKIALAEERGARPQMALLIDVSVPVGERGFSSDYVIPKVLFLGSNGLGGGTAITYNTGLTFVTTDSDNGSDTSVDVSYAVALSTPVGGSVSLFGEFFGSFVTGSGQPDRHSFQAGTTILLSSRFQIDFRVGAGLVDNEPEWLAGVGLAFRLPH